MPVVLLPPTKIEMSNTEILAVGYLDGFAQGRQGRSFNVVEYSEHCLFACIGKLIAKGYPFPDEKSRQKTRN